ncbi:hypothetical protein ABW21_db0200788 [Orbilia brochopaga]|nr:hypothetical protein ABW21_db0200788 [Drechslerella brochopaga]
MQQSNNQQPPGGPQPQRPTQPPPRQSSPIPVPNHPPPAILFQQPMSMYASSGPTHEQYMAIMRAQQAWQRSLNPAMQQAAPPPMQPPGTPVPSPASPIPGMPMQNVQSPHPQLSWYPQWPQLYRGNPYQNLGLHPAQQFQYQGLPQQAHPQGLPQQTRPQGLPQQLQHPGTPRAQQLPQHLPQQLPQQGPPRQPHQQGPPVLITPNSGAPPQQRPPPVPVTIKTVTKTGQPKELHLTAEQVNQVRALAQRRQEKLQRDRLQQQQQSTGAPQQNPSTIQQPANVRMFPPPPQRPDGQGPPSAHSSQTSQTPTRVPQRPALHSVQNRPHPGFAMPASTGLQTGVPVPGLPARPQTINISRQATPQLTQTPNLVPSVPQSPQLQSQSQSPMPGMTYTGLPPNLTPAQRMKMQAHPQFQQWQRQMQANYLSQLAMAHQVQSLRQNASQIVMQGMNPQQGSPQQGLSQLPQRPPQVPRTPQAPQTPQVRQISRVPQPPQSPQIPQVPQTPQGSPPMGHFQIPQPVQYPPGGPRPTLLPQQARGAIQPNPMHEHIRQIVRENSLPANLTAHQRTPSGAFPSHRKGKQQTVKIPQLPPMVHMYPPTPRITPRSTPQAQTSTQSQTSQSLLQNIKAPETPSGTTQAPLANAQSQQSQPGTQDRPQSTQENQKIETATQDPSPQTPVDQQSPAVASSQTSNELKRLRTDDIVPIPHPKVQKLKHGSVIKPKIPKPKDTTPKVTKPKNPTLKVPKPKAPKPQTGPDGAEIPRKKVQKRKQNETDPDGPPRKVQKRDKPQAVDLTAPTIDLTDPVIDLTVAPVIDITEDTTTIPQELEQNEEDKHIQTAALGYIRERPIQLPYAMAKAIAHLPAGLRDWIKPPKELPKMSYGINTASPYVTQEMKTRTLPWGNITLVDKDGSVIKPQAEKDVDVEEIRAFAKGLFNR